MKKLAKLSIKALLLATLLAVPLTSAVFAEDGTIEMVVSPNVLNLESNGGSISVHTDIGYDPDGVAVLLVGDQLQAVSVYTFPDSQGNLVVKASINTVKDLVTVGEAVFNLTYTLASGTYTGTDTIRVIQVIPQKP